MRLKARIVNIYVGNLSLQVTEQDLRVEFGAFGEVTSVVIAKDTYIGGGRTNGHAYVGMASSTAGAAALAGLNGKKLKHEAIHTIEALPLTPKKNAPSRKGTDTRQSPK